MTTLCWHRSTARLSLLALGLTGLFTGASHALTITQDESQTAANATGWNVTTIWDNNAAPNAANDYINPAGFVLRTPEANNTTFAGSSLTIRGALALKSANGADLTRTKTVNDLRLDGGALQNFTDGANSVQILAGNINVQSPSTVVTGNASQSRVNNLSAAISGSTQLTFSSTGGAASRNEISNATNTYSGLWALNSGLLRFTLAGSVGAGDIQVAGGTLEIQHNWNTPGSLLDVDGGTVALGNFNWTVDALSIGASNLAPDNYTAAELNTFGTGTFTGTGSITVVPEPSAALSLLGGFGLLLGLQRLRRRA